MLVMIVFEFSVLRRLGFGGAWYGFSESMGTAAWL